MRPNIFLFLVSSIILIKVTHSKAECNTCSDRNQMACVSETAYQFCVNNKPTGSLNKCPSGYICSTATAIICLRNVTSVAATCTQCNNCDPNLVFACTSANTYALCLGQKTPSTTMTGTCGDNQVCNVNSAQICASSTLFAPTCPTGAIRANTTTTTVSTPTFTTTAALPAYAHNFCSVVRINKRFKLPREVDTSCKRYISCFPTTSGNWSGQINTCGGTTYLDPVSLSCVPFKPSNC